jgi:hypothetical protein
MSNVGIHYHVHGGDSLEIAHDPATLGLPGYFVLRFGPDLTLFVDPPQLEGLGAKIEAALKPRCLSRTIYVASKTKHAAIWRDLRSKGVPINSTWIDEAGQGESEDLSDLAARCVSEASMAGALVLYSESDDVLKGALIEVGAALASGVPVFSVGNSVSLSTVLRCHPLWQECRSLEDAMDAAAGRLIEAAIAGVRSALAADPEIAEAVDAVRGAAEAQRWIAWPVGQYLIEQGWTLDDATDLSGYFRSSTRLLCAFVGAGGWTVLDGGGEAIAWGTTIAELRDALAGPVALPQLSEWSPEAPC